MSITFRILKKNFREPKKKGCQALKKMSNQVTLTILDLQETITKTETNNCWISSLKMIIRIKRIDMPKN